MPRGGALLFALLLSTAAHGQNCAPPDPDAEKKREACVAANGQWGRFGIHDHLCNVYSCVQRTTDGGKPCRGRADCEYLCTYPKETTKLGTEVTGQCAALRTTYGCTTYVEQGRITGRVCID